VPVIATNTGGIPDYVIPGENGLLFESGDMEGCSARVAEAFRHPDFSKGLVNAATFARTRTYLSSVTMAEKFFAGYEVALRQDRRAKGK
jgi:glycosyltransferase involved in cell wall biosynthesis